MVEQKRLDRPFNQVQGKPELRVAKYLFTMVYPTRYEKLEKK